MQLTVNEWCFSFFPSLNGLVDRMRDCAVALIVMVARRTAAAEYHVERLASTEMMLVCTCECSTHMVAVVPSSLRCQKTSLCICLHLFSVVSNNLHKQLHDRAQVRS